MEYEQSDVLIRGSSDDDADPYDVELDLDSEYEDACERDGDDDQEEEEETEPQVVGLMRVNPDAETEEEDNARDESSGSEMEVELQTLKKRRRHSFGAAGAFRSASQAGWAARVSKRQKRIAEKDTAIKQLTKNMNDLQAKVKQADADMKKMETQLKNKTTAKSVISRSAPPKALNNPVFPDSLRFDLEKEDQSDIDLFLLDFKDVTEMMDKKYRPATLRLRLSEDVRTQLRHHNKRLVDQGKKELTYYGTLGWLRKTFQRRDAAHVIFEQLLKIKQGKQPFRTYLARFESKVSQLDEQGVALADFTVRKFMVDGIKEPVRLRALEWSNFYSLPYEELTKRLEALDEAMSKSKTRDQNVSMVTTENVKAIVANAIKKQGGGGPHKKTGMQRDHRFSTKDMEPLYSKEDWQKRLAAVKARTAPSSNPRLFNKDCYPVVDGKPGRDAQKACVFCRKLGHTIDECKKCK